MVGVMKGEILGRLDDIARAEPLHVLLAVESGSRAWGFASPDSDYDVRMVYVRPPKAYLTIETVRDSFEYIENQWFDVGGWDVRKALLLLFRSNAVLLEWLQSPLVYRQDEDFVALVRELLPLYAHPAPLLYHYRGIARNALQAMDLDGEVRLKKWFYVLRPLLAARWVVLQGGVPPMTLHALMQPWVSGADAEIADLLALKAEKDEAYRHVLSPVLRKLTRDLADEVAALRVPARVQADMAPLDECFRATLQRVYGLPGL